MTISFGAFLIGCGSQNGLFEGIQPADMSKIGLFVDLSASWYRGMAELPSSFPDEIRFYSAGEDTVIDRCGGEACAEYDKVLITADRDLCGQVSHELGHVAAFLTGHSDGDPKHQLWGGGSGSYQVAREAICGIGQ